MPAVLNAPALLTGVRLDVGADGAAGRVRARVLDLAGREVVGDWVAVGPAAGSVLLPLPPSTARPGATPVALDQEGGGLRILADAPGASVRAFLGTPPQAIDREPDVVVTSAVPAIAPVFLPDRDGDLTSDDEDRTDLAVRAQVAPGSIAVTVTNRGPRPADRTSIVVGSADGVTLGALGPACSPQLITDGAVACGLDAPLAVGASATVALPVTAARRASLGVSVSSEGADLGPGDDATTVVVGPAPPAVAQLTLRGAARQRLGRALRVTVGSSRAGRVVLTASVRAGGRTVRLRRAVRFAAPGVAVVRLRPSRRQARALRAGLPRRGAQASVLAAGLGATEALDVRVVR